MAAKSSPTRTKKHIQEWCRTNILINEMDDEPLKHCLNDKIINVFGGCKSFFMILTKLANQEQIQSLNTIITQSKRKYDKEKNEQSVVNNNNNKQLSLESLPNDYISYICGFISKSDIKSMKPVSRKIGILCIDEMKKTEIISMTFNGSLIVSSSSRYNSKKSFNSLFDDWANKYNIPRINQMIFYKKRNESMDKLKLINHGSHANSLLNMYYVHRFLLVDNRKIIIVNENNKAQKYNKNIHSFQNIKDCALILIQYFDVKSTKFVQNSLQFIVCNKDKFTKAHLCQYIQKQLITANNHDDKFNKWYKTFQEKLKNCKNSPKIKLFGSKNDKWSGSWMLDLTMNQKLSCFVVKYRLNISDLGKTELTEMLADAGFGRNYIHRAFKVYEKNFGHTYLFETILELIARLQKKDRKKKLLLLNAK